MTTTLQFHRADGRLLAAIARQPSGHIKADALITLDALIQAVEEILASEARHPRHQRLPWTGWDNYDEYRRQLNKLRDHPGVIVVGEEIDREK